MRNPSDRTPAFTTPLPSIIVGRPSFAITSTNSKPPRRTRLAKNRNSCTCSMPPIDDQPPDQPDDGPSWNVLTERVSQLREKVIARDRLLAQNWHCGKYTQHIIATCNGDYFRKVSFHEDFLACGTASGTVIFYHLPSRRSLQSTLAHQGQVTAIHYSESFLASAGASDHNVKVWDCTSLESDKFWTTNQLSNELPYPSLIIETHNDIVTSVIVDGVQKIIYSTGLDGYVHVHDMQDGALKYSIHVGEPVYCMTLTEKKYLLVGCASGQVKAYQPLRNLFLLSIPCHKSHTTAIDFFEENQTLVTGDSSGNIRVWSFRDSTCLGDVPGHEAAVMSIQVDNAKIISAGRDGCVNVSMLNTLQRLYTIPGFTKYLATAFFDKTRLIADGTNDLIVGHYFDNGIDL